MRVPTIAAVVYIDAPGGTFEALLEWRRQGPRVGRRELLVRIVEEDGQWVETVLQDAPPPPPQPARRRVIRRRA